MEGDDDAGGGEVRVVVHGGAPFRGGRGEENASHRLWIRHKRLSRERRPLTGGGGASGRSPVVPRVPDGSLAAQPVALLQVERVFSVGVVPRLQLLPRQVGLLVEGAQQLALLLGPRGLAHLRGTRPGVFKGSEGL